MAHFGKDLDTFSAARTVRILGSEAGENFTIYLIEVSVGSYRWTVKHRYSDFHELHEKLVSSCKLDKNLLPPKKLFGNQSETFIKKRQGELEVYLQTVLYYLAHRVPPVLAYFLDFNKYEIHGITQALAEELYNKGETILQSFEVFQVSPLQLYALTERLKLPEPTCESGDVKKDIGHILDFITRLKQLRICGSNETVGTSNIDMNQLVFDLTLFKSIQYMEILNCSPKNIVGLETIKQTLQKFQLCRSAKSIREFLLQDIPQWRAEDGTLLVSYWEHVSEADISNNSIAEIDDSVQLMPRVERLNLSHNQLTSIQHLQWLSQLTYLDISNNMIRNLDSLHTKLGNLKIFKLSGNKLESLQGFSKLFSLETLDVSNNEIGQVSDVKPIGGLPCLENLHLTGNPVTIVLDYRTKVLEVFGDRVSEVILDTQKPDQKELDTVAVLQALQKAKDNKDKVKRLTPKKTASSASLTDSEYGCTPPRLSGDARNGHTPPSSVAIRSGSTQAVWGSPGHSSMYNYSSSGPLTRSAHLRQRDSTNQIDGIAGSKLASSAPSAPVPMSNPSMMDSYDTPGMDIYALATSAEEDKCYIEPGKSSPEETQKVSTNSDDETKPEDGEKMFTVGCEDSAEDSIQLPSDKTCKPTVINLSDLPTGTNAKFLNWLQTQLLGGGSPSREITQEPVLDILWCHAVQYSNPQVFFSCCAVLTKSKIFIERLNDLDSGLPGVPDFEPFYILPMCNIQQVVLGCCYAYIKLEESFVGKMGTFILVGLDPSAVRAFVESFRQVCQSLNSLNAPEMLDMSCDSDISRQIFNMEDKFESSSDRIVYSCVVVAKPSHTRCLLVLSENRVYLLDIDCIYWPLPTFEAEPEEMLQIGLMQDHPITDRISDINMYSAVSKVVSKKSPTRETNIRFAEFGLSMVFHEKPGPKQFDVLFPSTSSRDFYLDRLTNLRAEHAHRMSPTLREEPEGGNERVDPPDHAKLHKQASASSLPSSFDLNRYYVSKTHTTTNSTTPKIQVESTVPTADLSGNTEVHFSPVKKHRSPKEAIYSSVDMSVDEADSFTLAYLSDELEEHLKSCIRNYRLIQPLPTRLKPFALMDGRDLANFFHSNIAGKMSPDRGGVLEELHHVLWTNVVPYSNPKLEIPTLVMVSTRTIYFVSDTTAHSKSSSRPPWMTHARNQSDSAFAWKTDSGHNSTGKSAHKVKKRGALKPYFKLKYSDLQQLNVGLFDQCIRLTGQDENSVFTLAIRESVETGYFLQKMTGVLSLLATSPMVDKDKQDLEQDFYKAFYKRTKSTVEGLEYTHPSQVRFCYPGEDAIEDILYLVKERIQSSKPSERKQTLWMYILGYVVPEEFLTGSTDRFEPRTIILTNTHISLAEEDIVTYPLPDFVRGLPENPRHAIDEFRKIENLKRVVLYSSLPNVMKLIFMDEKEELVVDASLDYFSEESGNKGREPRPEFSVRLYIQNLSEKEKFVQLIKKHWKELNPEVGRILDVVTE